MSAPQKYPAEVRDRAIRLVDDLLADDQLQLSVTGACRRVGEQLGINRDTLRGWVKQAQIDAGARPGVSSDDRRRLVELERENRELRRANAILKTASAFFAAELDLPSPRSRFIDEHLHDSIDGRELGSSRSAGCCWSTAARSPQAATMRPGLAQCVIG